jgi:hypothetical protein
MTLNTVMLSVTNKPIMLRVVAQTLAADFSSISYLPSLQTLD